jgi:hypothetical protein
MKLLAKQPKHSVIDFCTALELFLKARLLREHWALVVSKIEDADLQSFRNGDFQSVTMDKCVQRLHHITNEKLHPHEEQCFQAIRNHRNKVVHFFHRAYSPPINPSLLADIVTEQYKAWFYLHRLLTVRWASLFVPYTKKIAALDKLLRRNRQFLASKFKAQESEILAAKKTGTIFHTCHSCSFPAAQVSVEAEPLHSRKCLVCGWGFNFLLVPCPKCDKDVIVESEEGGECEHCETSIGFGELMEKFGPREDPKEESAIAYCSFCEDFDATAVPFGEELYLCLNCLELQSSVGQCGYCGDLITGNTDDSSVCGCFRCGGPDLKD